MDRNLRLDVCATHLVLRWIVSLCIGIVICIPGVKAAGTGDVVPIGSPMANVVSFEFAVYYLPKPDSDPRQALKRLASKLDAGWHVVDSPSQSPAQPELSIRLEKDVQHNYAPPGMANLQYSGRGLSLQQAKALQNSKTALILGFTHSKTKVWTVLAAANRLAEQVARETDGLVWDEQTREVFTPDAWRAHRIESSDSVPDVRKHIIVHAYRSGERLRAVTLGMGKFGLPDVVINDVDPSLGDPLSHVVHAFCQAMAEGATFSGNREFDLDFDSIRHPAFRGPPSARLRLQPRAVARLAVRKGIREDGDAENRLLEVSMERYPGPDIHAKQQNMVAAAFDRQDSVTAIRDDDKALNDASRRAKAKLPALKAAFAAGLQPGEFILVKAPFASRGSTTEMMWVRITRWSETSIEGLLEDEPVQKTTLHAGQVVRLAERDVFDYVRRFADGREDGGETDKIIKEMRRAK
ncbi:MAG TPA: DUF2314 domain-containing protein [Burkholderiales bacterium]|nr:DUF2314 domain-containing protein [Burkholderiales bacterium]